MTEDTATKREKIIDDLCNIAKDAAPKFDNLLVSVMMDSEEFEIVSNAEKAVAAVKDKVGKDGILASIATTIQKFKEKENDLRTVLNDAYDTYYSKLQFLEAQAKVLEAEEAVNKAEAEAEANKTTNTQEKEKPEQEKPEQKEGNNMFDTLKMAAQALVANLNPNGEFTSKKIGGGGGTGGANETNVEASEYEIEKKTKELEAKEAKDESRSISIAPSDTNSHAQETNLQATEEKLKKAKENAKKVKEKAEKPQGSGDEAGKDTDEQNFFGDLWEKAKQNPLMAAGLIALTLFAGSKVKDLFSGKGGMGDMLGIFAAIAGLIFLGPVFAGKSTEKPKEGEGVEAHTSGPKLPSKNTQQQPAPPYVPEEDTGPLAKIGNFFTGIFTGKGNCGGVSPTHASVYVRNGHMRGNFKVND